MHVPGMDSIPSMGGRRPASPQGAPSIPSKKLICPFGHECRACKIALHKGDKLECSITVLAIEVMKAGIKVGRDG